MIPEQTFFPDPALDRAFGVVMALATEVWVLQATGWPGSRRNSPRGEWSIARRCRASRRDDAAREEREAFVAHLMQNLLGVQQAKGTR